MESLSDAAARVSATLRDRRDRRDQLHQSQHSEEELENYRSVFMMIDSLLNDLGDTVSELPAELIDLRMEAERLLRRFQLCHSQEEDEFRGELWWFQFYGNATDLDVIHAVRSSVSSRYPDSAERVDATCRAISERIGERTKIKRTNWRIVAASSVAASCLVAVTSVSVAQHGFGRYEATLAIGVAAGLISGLFLLVEGFIRTRSPISRICFVAASILMFVETAGLLERIGEAR